MKSDVFIGNKSQSLLLASFPDRIKL